MPPRSGFLTTAAPGARRRNTLPNELRPLATLATVVLVVAYPYWGRAILIPVALATLFTFLLSPIVGALHRQHLGRIPSVLVVVLLALCMVGGTGWVLTRQLIAFADGLPRYSTSIRQRIADLRGLDTGGSVQKVQRTVNEVVGEIQKSDPTQAVAKKAIPVVVEPPPSLLSHLPGVLDTAATAAVVSILVIFMLLERLDLRNRLIRLVGHRRLTVTTRALDETGLRISHYLLMQSLINGSFGIAVGLAMLLLGIPYAALWGVLAALLRFIPYVGPWMAALLPTTLALALFPGWSRPLLTVGVFLALEVVASTVAEPWLYGQSAGVSQVALLVAVLFWAWLWGPIGLLLATPLTVCLIVLAKHLPALSFVVVLLGDEPVLEPKARYYQRLLAHDPDEAADIVSEYLKANPPESVYDEVLLPALYFANQDRQREHISEVDAQFIAHTTQELLDDLVDDSLNAATTRTAGSSEGPPPLLLLCPARDEIDCVALDMVEHVLDVPGSQIDTLSAHLLAAEVAHLVAERRPAMLCIGSVAPGGLAHIRHLCKRVRARCPEIKVVVGRWGLHEEQPDERQQLLDAGADRVGTSVLERQRHLAELSLLAVDVAPQGEETSMPRTGPSVPALSS